jgi:hypothetical protein
MPRNYGLSQAPKYVLLFFALTLWFSTFSPAAAEEGTFTGTWVATGERQLQDFMAGRRVFTFRLHGHMNLKTPLGQESDYWTECSGLWDAATGADARCVWRGQEGQNVFVVLNGQPLETGVQVSGQIIGGTGRLEGIEGAFTFTWTSVFINKDTASLTGHTKNIAGTYRIP